MTKKWDMEHKDFLLEYKRKYRIEHPDYVAKEKLRMSKVNMFRKEWKRLLGISLTPLEN